MTDAAPSVHFDISVRPEGDVTLVTKALGLVPYVNIEIETDDDDDITFVIRAGGGVSSDADEVVPGLVTFFEGLAEYLQAASVDAVAVAVAVADDEDADEDAEVSE